MSLQNPTLVEDSHDGAETPHDDDPEVEMRLQSVKQLRLRRLSAKAIAAILGEPEDVIKQDLQRITVDNRQKYGPARTLDAADEIGWAIADFEEMESAAWLEFYALKKETTGAGTGRKVSPIIAARARQGWLRTAAMMRVLRVKLLAEHGYLTHHQSALTPGGGTVGMPDDIRQHLRSEGLLQDIDVPASPMKALEAHVVSVEDQDPPDPVEQALERWADEGGFFGDEH
jgi:hypothetical protein